ncbi:hypothetical protein [Geopseudomonas aromaticivorans]
MNPTEKFCTKLPFAGPAANYFIALSLAVANQIDQARLDALDQPLIALLKDELKDGFGVELGELDLHEAPAKRAPHEDVEVIDVSFEPTRDLAADFSDNEPFRIARERDELFVQHLPGTSQSEVMNELIRSTLARFDLSETVVINYALDDDRPSTTSYGGGALAISADGIRCCTSNHASMVAQMMLAGDEARQDSALYKGLSDMVSKMLRDLGPEEQLQLLGTLQNVALNTFPDIEARLEEQRNLAAEAPSLSM